MGAEFIRGEDRYCLWLEGITPNELAALPKLRSRVESCRAWRLAQVKTGDAYKLADRPHLLRPCGKFQDGTYIGVPKVSSERRDYIPMSFVTDGMIPGNKLYFVPTDSRYVFGVLVSLAHNAWMRVVAGGGFVDVWIRDASVMVEQKSLGVDLDAPEMRQGVLKTPLAQVWDYAADSARAEPPTRCGTQSSTRRKVNLIYQK